MQLRQLNLVPPSPGATFTPPNAQSRKMHRNRR